jgi:dethiobiotin synthetase
MNETESTTLFVTGTDTGCGKTTVTALLARWLAGRDVRVACFKPIASGCERRDGRLVNADAVELMAAMNVELAYDRVNPVALEPPIAPHIAAEKASIVVDLDRICSEIAATAADVRLVEGVGGWLVPLEADRLLPELPHRLQCPVILVVGMRLGCLNHALLTARAIAGDGFRLVGWIANYLDDDFDEPAANEATLDRMLPAPRLARAHRRGDDAALEPGAGLAAALRRGRVE